MFIAFILIAVAVVVWGAFAFNRLVRLRNQVRNAWADIDVQLRRRHDLVPQLVEAVKGYKGYEQSVLTSVTELRTQAMATTSPARLGETEAALEKGLAKILALKEAYPDLKANQSFLQLQRDLVGIEDNLQYARRFYNGAVRDYNTAIQRFPDMLVARTGGFTESEFFSADESDRPVVQVGLS
ncbi:MAG TPA: LemA family protein [Gemmatimonadaceae bacterium]|nr:LemA family protein [Gemmatimonadaceae bacterium]